MYNKYNKYKKEFEGQVNIVRLDGKEFTEEHTEWFSANFFKIPLINLQNAFKDEFDISICVGGAFGYGYKSYLKVN